MVKIAKSTSLVVDAQGYEVLSICGSEAFVRAHFARGAIHDELKAKIQGGALDIIYGVGESGEEAEVIIRMQNVRGADNLKSDRLVKLLADLKDVFAKHNLKFALLQ